MVSKKRKITPDEEAEDEAYYVSVKDMPFDILRQRIAQSTGAERRAARKELLLKMGAKPEKRSCVNYRQLMEEKKAAKRAAITDYRNERFKKTTLERQLGKHTKSKKSKKRARKLGKRPSAAAGSK
ncbi:unnamed protein product [Dibothriocephalus latus]|uniref:Uncharacterized protein n=1 Tax=Dibothriocephalus latus TaxID=60516 RepID=A0A3P7LM54_DIBLA|nr:unnamed protein product [Dibothriocephalus latus]